MSGQILRLTTLLVFVAALTLVAGDQDEDIPHNE